MGSPVGVFQAETGEMKEHLWGETNLCCVPGHSGDIILDRTCGREDPGLEYFIHYYQKYPLSFCISSPQPILLSYKSHFQFF